jgi:hypothetical protein
MRINGFTQIKAFYSWCFENQDKVKPHHVSLYMFLLNQNNRCNWVEWFKLPMDLGMAGSCISSKKTYYQCLNDLQDFGLLKYERGANNWKAPKIRIEVLKDTSTVPQVDTQVLPQPIPLPTPQLNPFNNNLKPNNQITNKQEGVNVDGFILWFNKMMLKHNGKEGKFKKLSPTDINNLTKLKELEFENHDWEKAFISMNKSEWVINNKMCNPSHYLRNENFQKYLNQYEPNSEQEFTFAWNR